MGATLQLQRVGTLRTFSLDNDQTLISEAEGTLDANGASTLQTTARLRSDEVERELSDTSYGDKTSGDSSAG